MQYLDTHKHTHTQQQQLLLQQHDFFLQPYMPSPDLKCRCTLKERGGGVRM